MPAALARSVSMEEARSPSMAPSRTRPRSASSVRKIRLVVPAPGEAIMLSARTPALSNAARLRTANASFAERMFSTTVMRSGISLHLNAFDTQLLALMDTHAGAVAGGAAEAVGIRREDAPAEGATQRHRTPRHGPRGHVR